MRGRGRRRAVIRVCLQACGHFCLLDDADFYDADCFWAGIVSPSGPVLFIQQR